MACHERFGARLQSVHQLQQGVGFEPRGDYTIPVRIRAAGFFSELFIFSIALLLRSYGNYRAVF